MAKYELKGNILHCKAVFIEDDGVDYQEVGLPYNKVPKEEIVFRLKLDRVESWNEGSEQKTTVRMKSGTAYSIDCPIKEFDELIYKFEQL